MQADQLRLAPYRPDLAARWNHFVGASKNGTFLFDRRYMDYHADRFTDCSLVAFEGEDESRLVAVFPANRQQRPGGDLIVSHGGLSYGGWVSDARMTTPGMLRLFELLKRWGGSHQAGAIRYKAIPRCYHQLPAEEDLYALFRSDWRLVRQDVSSVVELQSAPAWSKGRKHALSKARSSGVRVVRSADFTDFHACLAEALARHDAAPVHSPDELALLADRFPERIQLYAAELAKRAIAYTLVFDCGQAVHTQYMAARDEGRALGGLEAIIHHLQHDQYADRRYLSFGISTENEGRDLNEGLISQKEMFGARPMVCSFYEIG
jgi:hypothetical protein